MATKNINTHKLRHVNFIPGLRGANVCVRPHTWRSPWKQGVLLRLCWSCYLQPRLSSPPSCLQSIIQSPACCQSGSHALQKKHRNSTAGGNSDLAILKHFYADSKRALGIWKALSCMWTGAILSTWHAVIQWPSDWQKHQDFAFIRNFDHYFLMIYLYFL